ELRRVLRPAAPRAAAGRNARPAAGVRADERRQLHRGRGVRRPLVAPTIGAAARPVGARRGAARPARLRPPPVPRRRARGAGGPALTGVGLVVVGPSPRAACKGVDWAGISPRSFFRDRQGRADDGATMRTWLFTLLLAALVVAADARAARIEWGPQFAMSVPN